MLRAVDGGRGPEGLEQEKTVCYMLSTGAQDSDHASKDGTHGHQVPASWLFQ
jgi:hypothetical protein